MLKRNGETGRRFGVRSSSFRFFFEAASLSLILASLLAVAACGRSTPGGPIQIGLTPAARNQSAFIEVTGLGSAELASLRDAKLGTDQWQALLTVTVGEAPAAPMPPVLGAYKVTESTVTFTPLFPFDPGRSYRVRFDPSRLPARAADRRPDLVTRLVGLPPVATEPTTIVMAVHPTAMVWPENLLRLYIDFSAPMGNGSARDYVHIFDDAGKEVDIPFLAVETDFWNPEHTRRTLFFDPGRVKQDIRPNRELGRPLLAGHKYVLKISSDWKDAQNQPLKAPFQREFRVGPADENPILMSAWKIAAPQAGTRNPLVVTFPKPLDHGMLPRVLTVERKDRRLVDGTVSLEAEDTRWLFAPAGPWTAGEFDLVALEVLEDPMGNRITHPFEVPAEANRDQSPPEFRLPFVVK